ncbi:hypothetical protein ACL02S_22775 [Nocardia sp. 004]|uniref:hypothetical protein n=1 Tax=Nocardia sp. 004 TaxID=3385978 RepID=UPI0039A06FC1
MPDLTDDSDARITGIHYATEAATEIEDRLRTIPGLLAAAETYASAVRREVGELLDTARQIGADRAHFDRRPTPPSGRDVSTPSVRRAAELTGLTRPTLLNWRETYLTHADTDDVTEWSTQRLAAAHLRDLDAGLLHVPFLEDGNAVSRELLRRYPRLDGVLLAARILADYHLTWNQKQHPEQANNVLEALQISEPALETASAHLHQHYIDWITDMAKPLWPPTDPAIRALLPEN